MHTLLKGATLYAHTHRHTQMFPRDAKGYTHTEGYTHDQPQTDTHFTTERYISEATGDLLAYHQQTPAEILVIFAPQNAFH